MASQLQQVLNRFSDQSAPLSLRALAHEMQLEPGVLHGMLEYWVRKGKLREVGSGGESCTTCGIKGACPFVVHLPRYYERVTEDSPAGGTCAIAAPSCACGSNSCGCH